MVWHFAKYQATNYCSLYIRAITRFIIVWQQSCLSCDAESLDQTIVNSVIGKDRKHIYTRLYTADAVLYRQPSGQPTNMVMLNLNWLRVEEVSWQWSVGRVIVPRLSTWYDVTWYDMTWHDGARCDMTWHDMTLRDMTWRDMTCHDVTWGTWRDMTWHDVTWRDMRYITWHDVAWRDMTWYDVAWRDMTWYDVTWRDIMRHNATWRDATLHNMTWHDVRSVSQRNKNELYCMWDGWDIVEKLFKPF